jgi:hypothetical protein
MGNIKIMSKEDLRALIHKQRWKDIIKLNIDEVAPLLDFKEGLQLAYELLYNKSWDDELQEYAVQLLYVIRKTFPQEWNASWQHDAFLGEACEVTYKYDERYLAYKKAFDAVTNPLPGLLIALANCCVCPGPTPISFDDALELVKRAVKDYLYIDAVGLMHILYSRKNDTENTQYWKELMTQLKDTNKRAPRIIPEFLWKDR